MSFSARRAAALLGLLSVFGGAALPRPAASAPNLLTPLTDGQKWRLHTDGQARASLRREGAVDVITMSALDGVPYHGLFEYFGPSLEDGQTYTLRFRAKADADRTLPVYALMAGGDYHGIGLIQSAKLTPEWHTFSYTFTVANRGQGAAIICPQFTVGNAVGTTYLSDISLVRAAPGAATTPGDPPLWRLQLFDPAQATLATEGTAQVMTITQTDGESWHAQLERVNASVKDGVPVTVRFRAKADKPRDMMFAGVIKEGDYHAICDQQYVALTTAWRDYTYRVTPRASAGHPISFPQFLVGKQTGTVWVDKLTVSSSGTAAPDAPAAPVSAAPDMPLLLPRVGEIRLEGVIAPEGFGADGFTLLAQQVIQPDGRVVTLPQPRPKVVHLGDLTSYRALDEKDAAGFSQASLKPGDSVSVIGHDAGVGKDASRPARVAVKVNGKGCKNLIFHGYLQKFALLSSPTRVSGCRPACLQSSVRKSCQVCLHSRRRLPTLHFRSHMDGHLALYSKVSLSKTQASWALPVDRTGGRRYHGPQPFWLFGRFKPGNNGTAVDVVVHVLARPARTSARSCGALLCIMVAVSNRDVMFNLLQTPGTWERALVRHWCSPSSFSRVTLLLLGGRCTA